MSIKILAIGDPHFKLDNLQYLEEFISKCIKAVEKKKPDMVVVLGDLLHTNEKIITQPLKYAIKFLKELKDRVFTVLIIGNHDYINNSCFLTDDHPFTALKEWDNFLVVDNVNSLEIENKRYVFVPYVPPGRFQEALNKLEVSIEEEKPEAIFAHQEFYEAQMGAVKSINGDKWSEEGPLIISGHIHDYQQVQENIIYVGTPFQHKYGESDDKAIMLLEFLEDNENINIERIDLDMKKKKIMEIEAKDIELFKPPKNYDIKLRIKGTEAELKSVLKTKYIKALTEKGIKLDTALKRDKKIKKDTDKKRKQLANMDFLNIFYALIENNEDAVEWFEKNLGSIKDNKPEIQLE